MQHARLVANEIAHAQSIGEEGRSEMVDIIMQGFQRVNKVSSFNLDPDSTPFGTMEEVRGEVSSVLEEVAKLGRLPVVTFSAGGISTPADAALMMKHGMDGIFVGSGIFKSSDPIQTAEAIVLATHHYEDPSVVAEASAMIGEPMPGLEIETLDVRLEERGW